MSAFHFPSFFFLFFFFVTPVVYSAKHEINKPIQPATLFPRRLFTRTFFSSRLCVQARYQINTGTKQPCEANVSPPPCSKPTTTTWPGLSATHWTCSTGRTGYWRRNLCDLSFGRQILGVAWGKFHEILLEGI